MMFFLKACICVCGLFSLMGFFEARAALYAGIGLEGQGSWGNWSYFRAGNLNRAPENIRNTFILADTPVQLGVGFYGNNMHAYVLGFAPSSFSLRSFDGHADVSLAQTYTQGFQVGIETLVQAPWSGESVGIGLFARRYTWDIELAQGDNPLVPLETFSFNIQAYGVSFSHYYSLGRGFWWHNSIQVGGASIETQRLESVYDDGASISFEPLGFVAFRSMVSFSF